MANDEVAQPFSVYYVSCALGGGYVGITKWAVRKRFARHLRNAQHGRGGVLYDAIRRYGADAFHVELLQHANDWDEACVAERRFIAEFGTKAPCGYNMTDGGGGTGGYEFTDEVRKRMSESGSRKTLSPEHRARIGEANRKRVVKQSTKDKIRAAKKGKQPTEEARARMRAARKGKPKPPGMVGRAHSAETKAKMRAAALGKPKSAETKAKMSVAKKARLADPAARAAIGERTRNYYAEHGYSAEKKAAQSATLAATHARRKAACEAAGLPYNTANVRLLGVR